MGNPQSTRRQSVNSDFNQTALVNHQVISGCQSFKIDVFSLGTQKTRAGWERGPQAGCSVDSFCICLAHSCTAMITMTSTCTKHLTQSATPKCQSLNNGDAKKVWESCALLQTESKELMKRNLYGMKMMKMDKVHPINLRCCSRSYKTAPAMNFDLSRLDWISLYYLVFVHRILQSNLFAVARNLSQERTSGDLTVG